MNLYPLLMAPFFRCGEATPWGGTMLRDLFGKEAADDRTGESLEVSCLKDRESVVRNGLQAGKTLTKVAEAWGEALTGSYGGGEFPLLLKLLDAQDFLSVQVHPGDEYGMAHDGKLGKSEAWVVLNCEPGAKIAYGLDTNGEDLRKIVAEGRLEARCTWWKCARATCTTSRTAPCTRWAAASSATRSSSLRTRPTAFGTGDASARTASRASCTWKRRWTSPWPTAG